MKWFLNLPPVASWYYFG